MKVNRKCRKCGETIVIDSNSLIRKDAYDEEGKYYKIMYCDCEHCGERDAIQIDDMETIEIFRELKKMIIKTQRKKIKGETINPKAVRKKDKLMKNLRKKRELLQKECSGKKIYDENKKIIFERLTFSEVGDIIESNL